MIRTITILGYSSAIHHILRCPTHQQSHNHRIQLNGSHDHVRRPQDHVPRLERARDCDATSGLLFKSSRDDARLAVVMLRKLDTPIATAQIRPRRETKPRIGRREYGNIRLMNEVYRGIPVRQWVEVESKSCKRWKFGTEGV